MGSLCTCERRGGISGERKEKRKGEPGKGRSGREFEKNGDPPLIPHSRLQARGGTEVPVGKRREQSAENKKKRRKKRRTKKERKKGNKKKVVERGVWNGASQNEMRGDIMSRHVPDPGGEGGVSQSKSRAGEGKGHVQGEGKGARFRAKACPRPSKARGRVRPRVRCERERVSSCRRGRARATEGGGRGERWGIDLVSFVASQSQPWEFPQKVPRLCHVTHLVTSLLLSLRPNRCPLPPSSDSFAQVSFSFSSHSR